MSLKNWNSTGSISGCSGTCSWMTNWQEKWIYGRLAKAERVSFSPNGQLLAAVYSGGKRPNGRIWNTNGWSEVCEFDGHSSGTVDVAFHSDGKRIATASWDRTVKIREVETGHELLTLSGKSWMTAVAFFSGRTPLGSGWNDGCRTNRTAASQVEKWIPNDQRLFSISESNTCDTKYA